MLLQIGQRSPLHLARGYKRHAMGNFRRRKQLWDCSQLHVPCRGVIQLSWCRFMRWRNTQPGSRAAAAGAIHRVEPGAVAPPGRFTYGTDELCSGRRLASRRVCCARSISHGAVCIPPDDHTRIRSPCCPSPARGRPRTSRAASYGMPRAIAGGKSSFGTAASCICCVVGFIISQMQAEDGGNYTIEQQSSGKRCDSSRCTVHNSSVRPIYPRKRRAMQR